jgi:hypothetical protein
VPLGLAPLKTAIAGQQVAEICAPQVREFRPQRVERSRLAPRAKELKDCVALNPRGALRPAASAGGLRRAWLLSPETQRAVRHVQSASHVGRRHAAPLDGAASLSRAATRGLFGHAPLAVGLPGLATLGGPVAVFRLGRDD